MTATTGGGASIVDRLASATDRLLVRPTSSWPLAFARILLGIGLLGWAVSLAVDVPTFLADDGLLPPEFASDGFRWFDLDTTTAVWFALVALVVCAVAITVGFRPTIFLVFAFVLLVSLQRRSPAILNSGDVALRNLTLLLALTPCGAALSVDRWRRHGRDALRTAPLVAPWGVRLVQLQMMVIYFMAFWGKSGDLWRSGTAVSTSLRLDDLQRFGTIDVLTQNVTVVAVLTWGTLAVELALATMLWYPRARPVLIALGVALHVMIGGLMLVGFFGIAMIAGLATFLDGDAIQRRVDARRSRNASTPDPDDLPQVSTSS